MDKGGGWRYRFVASSASLTLTENMKIWCNILVIIYPLFYFNPSVAVCPISVYNSILLNKFFQRKVELSIFLGDKQTLFEYCQAFRNRTLDDILLLFPRERERKFDGFCSQRGVFKRFNHKFKSTEDVIFCLIN